MKLPLSPCITQGMVADDIKRQRNAMCSSNLFPNVSGGKQGIQKVEEE